MRFGIIGFGNIARKFVKSIDNIITDIFADTNVVEYC